MTLKEIGEFGFIRKISNGCLIRPDNILKAIGDDAAAFKTSPGEVLLVTTDMLIEGIHFIRTSASGYDLGHKSMAVNLSDIAAMGGFPKEVFVSIAIPKTCEIDYLEDIYKGMKSLSERYGVNILGGNTTSSHRDLIINITLIGTASEDRILYRHTALPGDKIYSTGYLGDSRAGLHLILNNLSPESPEEQALYRAHILPHPHIEQGLFLAQSHGVHAAIDVSDGLSSDIAHIAEESHCGIRLYLENIPISDNLKTFCRKFGFDPVEYVLSGGEDYVLLFTVAPENAFELERAYLKQFQQPIYCLGEIIADQCMEAVYPNGDIRLLRASGWDHFAA